jgi:hypothetical protein
VKYPKNRSRIETKNFRLTFLGAPLGEEEYSLLYQMVFLKSNSFSFLPFFCFRFAGAIPYLLIYCII